LDLYFPPKVEVLPTRRSKVDQVLSNINNELKNTRRNARRAKVWAQKSWGNLEDYMYGNLGNLG